MALVGVRAHLVQKLVPVLTHGRDVDGVHLVKIGGVKARRQKRVLHRQICCSLAVEGVSGLLDCLKAVFYVQGVCGMDVHSFTSSENENSQSSMNSKSPVKRVHCRSIQLARVIVAVRSSRTT